MPRFSSWHSAWPRQVESGFLRPCASAGHTSGGNTAATRHCAWLNGAYDLEQGDSLPEMHTVRSAPKVPNGVSDLVGGHQAF